MWLIGLKHLFFRHFTVVVVVLGSAALVLLFLFGGSLDWKAVIPAVGVLLSTVFFVQKQRLDELKLFSALFKAFNERYDELNERLANIEKKPSFDRADEATLVDYFNLCGEEYLYYKLGYIFPEVWQAWLQGMRHYYARPLIREKWESELREESYYGLSAEILKPNPIS